MRLRVVVAAFFIVAWLGGPMAAWADGIVIEPIHIAQDTGEAIARGAVVRGERALYAIDAQTGQRLTLSITAFERNAVFQLYAPGARPERRDYGVEIVGEALSGAAEGEDATKWVGTLEHTGAYLVAVGSTRGNATFSLTIEVH